MYRYVIPPTGPIILNSSKSNNNLRIMAHFVRKHDRVLGGRRKRLCLILLPLTAVSTHEEHHFSVYYEGVKLNPGVDTVFSSPSSFLSLFKVHP